jgi:pimeloyl-ACP methyl ester carboxylesterase
MPFANIRGVNLNYEVLGTHGPWLALSPGGRRALDLVKPLAQRMADAGYRVLVHDRRNCGLSDIAIGGESSEYEIWADDLHELLTRLDALPAVLGGGSSGCRLSLLSALKYPRAVRALLLWRSPAAPSPRSASPKTIMDNISAPPAPAAWRRFASLIISWSASRRGRRTATRSWPWMRRLSLPPWSAGASNSAAAPSSP